MYEMWSAAETTPGVWQLRDWIQLRALYDIFEASLVSHAKIGIIQEFYIACCVKQNQFVWY